MRNEIISKEDKALINGCLKGSSLSQERLFKKYYALMLGVCLRYANDRMEARDILQEGYVKIFANLAKYKQEGSFKGWMKRIMVNTAIDNYRKKATEPFAVDINENLDVTTDENVFSGFQKNDILKCIEKLPSGYRTVFNLYAIEGYSHKEIAEKLGISEGTSKSQLYKAKHFLQKLLKEINSENDR